jgi:hypothetical protein
VTALLTAITEDGPDHYTLTVDDAGTVSHYGFRHTPAAGLPLVSWDRPLETELRHRFALLRALNAAAGAISRGDDARLPAVLDDDRVTGSIPRLEKSHTRGDSAPS